MEEIWVDIKDYEGLYQVSNLGRVKSLERIIIRRLKGEICVKERILKPSCDKDGYLKVFLSKNGIIKPFLVHRLVAMAFIPNPDNLPCVNHKDEDKQNNIPENLEWCDVKYNSNYGTAKYRWGEKQRGEKNSRSKVIIQMDMEGNIIKRWGSLRDIDRYYGKSVHSAISRCCKGMYEQMLGCKWKFEEEDN